MWTAPIGKHFLAYQTIWSASVICPACWCGLMTAGPDEIRLPWSLSLRRALRLLTVSGCPWLFAAAVSVITSFLLFKLEPANSCRMLLGTARWAQALTYVAVRNPSPVVMIAQQILASLLARATATSRSGFLAP